MPDESRSVAAEPARRRLHWPLVVGGGCLVAVIASGLIATLIAPQLVKGLVATQRAKAQMDVAMTCEALDRYAQEHGGRYPDELQLLLGPSVGGQSYLRGRTSLPLDPWGRPYGYQPPVEGRTYRVFSYGRDGLPGGEYQDADIDSGMLTEGR